MGLFSKKSVAAVDDAEQSNENIDKIVEYLTDRMDGIDNRFSEIDNKMGESYRLAETRFDAISNELWPLIP